MTENLLDDLLCHIMLDVWLLDSRTKFTLSSVCARWRAVALDNALLWATMAVCTPEGYRALPLMLSRSGAAPLNLELHCGDDAALVAQYVEALATLQPLFPRLRRLVLSSSSPVSLPSLFGTSARLPELQSLRIEGAHNIAVESFHLATPSLRRLTLRGFLFSVSWDDIFAPTLRTVQIGPRHKTVGLSVLEAIFKSCPSIERIEISIASDSTPRAADNAPLSLQVLRHNAVQLDLLGLMQCTSDHHPIERLLTSLGDARVVPRELELYALPHAVEPFLAQMLRHVGAVVELSVQPREKSRYGFVLETASGRKRCMSACHCPPDWSAPLSAMQLHTVRRVTLHTHVLACVLRQDFAWPALELLTIQGDLPSALQTEWKLTCADVGKVVVDLQGKAKPMRATVFGVVWRIKRHARGPRPCVVCFANRPLVPKHEGDKRARAWGNLRETIEALEDGSWKMCTDCCKP